MGASYEHGNGPSNFEREGEFLGLLMDGLLSKKGFTPWTQKF
jgi:hypothetical protein